ncbi:hypothetical protein EDD11_006717 [Mortierella claussenii]|nr:hypothetical protein EDD11_006717 [Mortierella claussenii]
MAGVGMSASGMMVAHATGAMQTTHAQQQEWVPGLLSKRVASWQYVTRVFQGGMVLYNTALVSEQEMRHIWTEDKMQRRSLQFFFLGTSLAATLDIPRTADCIKALSHVMQEFEYFAVAESRSKSKFFKSSARKVAVDGEDAGEYLHLEVRTIPFNLDYVVTTATLCDMISQVYEKLRHQQHHQDQHWTVATLEMFSRVDARFKKILTLVYKELEGIARATLVEELNAIDPLGLNSSSLQDDDWDA